MGGLDLLPLQAQVRLHSLSGVPIYIHEARNHAFYHAAAAILAVKGTRRLLEDWEKARRGRYGWTEDWKSSVRFARWLLAPGAGGRPALEA